MISNKAIRPGMVIETSNGKKVEITDTDAEGRLCLVDAINYIILSLDTSNCIILDIATLTGNVYQISSGYSSICTCNNKGAPYLAKLIKIGENIGEYIDFLKIRDEYVHLLTNTLVADIKSINLDIRADCIMAAVFLNYFMNPDIPWIHMDVGSSTYNDGIPLSYGINLLYEFIKN
jgi:leucyl aminopeptidase